MTKYISDPTAIEKLSMEIIAPYLARLNLDDKTSKVFSRIIHASGDPAYADIIAVHPQAVEAGHKALRRGADIFTDVEMVRIGINKRKIAEYGGAVHCLIADEEVAQKAKGEGITRSMAAMRTFNSRLNDAVVAIGNAPTALFALIEMMEKEHIRPALIVGVPVGFVGAAESKELLAKVSPVPYITVRGNKGGSPIAAATVNALLYMAE